MKNLLKNSWKEVLKDEFEKPYFKKIEVFLNSEIKKGKIIYPKKENIFNILNSLELKNIKVVIIGQDPYFKENQAHGLSFSVPKGVNIPPSLKNIFKEMGKGNIENGDLNYLVEQGVFLLNSILTVEAEKPASHSKIGWEIFTDKIIEIISNNNENVVFLLWGNYAKSKSKLIDKNKHLILETSHPSPLGSYRGFLGSGCFLETNKYLKEKGKKEINW